MNTTKQVFLLFVLIALSLPSFAQKLKIKKGDFSALSDQKTISLVFDYSEMSVGKYKKESEYVNKKVKDKNKDEKGSGDAWKKAWEGDREQRFEVNFLELFNKHIEDKGLKSSKSMEDSQYKLVVKTVHTEPGYNIGISRRDAHINIDYLLYEKGNDKPICHASMEKIKGRDAMGFDFDNGERMAEAYAKAGKELGQYLSKKVL